MIFGFHNKKAKGFTLIELMIAILIGSLVVAATLTIYLTTIRGSSNTLKLTRLNQDMGVTMLIMTNEIRRAGYWGGAIVGANLTLNPFSDVLVRNFDGVTNACITYSYDANAYDAPGYNPAVDSTAPAANEFFGFRLNGGAIQIKNSGTTSTDVACNDGVWVNLTDPEEITITNLQFNITADNTATNASGNTVTARRVAILLAGESESDNEIVATMSDVVKIRNNLIDP